MDDSTADRNELLSRLPPSPEVDHTELLRKLIRQSGRKVIVLDDDPTGTQTVHDIPVWRCGPDSRLPGLPLVVFPGNVGDIDALTVHFEFEQLPVVWRHRLWGATEYNSEVNNGVLLYGDEATIFASDQKWVLLPKAKSAQREEHSAPADLGALHMANFLDSVRTRERPDCLVEEGFQATATVQLGMIAYESASVVQWDCRTERILNNPEAAKLLKREYRKPYAHPYQG